MKNMSEIQVIKRNGDREDLDIDKLHKVVFHACDDITGVSPSQVEIKSNLQFYKGITI
jgi:ribonucleoside-diphosphate reductase alpha chain